MCESLNKLFTALSNQDLVYAALKMDGKLNYTVQDILVCEGFFYLKDGEVPCTYYIDVIGFLVLRNYQGVTFLVKPNDWLIKMADGSLRIWNVEDEDFILKPGRK